MQNTVIGAFMTGVRSNTPEFTNALLDTQQFDNEIKKNLGATINQITTGEFKKMLFYVPEETEQIKLGSFFTSLDHLITLHQRTPHDSKNDRKVKFVDSNKWIGAV
jgi:type I restriction enzyme S subunit